MTASSASVANQPAAQERARPRRSNFRLLAVVLLIMAAAAVFVWRGMFAKSTPDNVIVVSGRIEGDDSAVASKLAGASSKSASGKATS